MHKNNQINESINLRLERSCKSSASAQIISSPSVSGLSRIQARFIGDFFEPHRHDTYALGLTMQGIQAFGYRGDRRYSQPGQIIVLHPDELHDGGSGTDEGLLYRMLYLEPSLIRDALGEKYVSLPFVETPVLDDPELQTAMIAALGELECNLSDLARDDTISQIAHCLVRHAKGSHAKSSKPSVRKTHSSAVDRAKDFLYENACRNVHSEELEQITGMDRFTLSRHFRKAFGTSPHRFLIMRRLEFARRMIEEKHPLADIAFTVGFADQSHLNRHFKKAYGISPGQWASYCNS
ncbi:AraC family transcriptional regulator [Kiloniella litopenaei]|uniref:AraC family transcriptional regulator n=1 Tax=Kiloniella litopenaei TaxID=1549748 RepID=UPI000A76C7FF|nr:AraC family transcriptional regulator [Kiloniella litopenaei]